MEDSGTEDEAENVTETLALFDVRKVVVKYARAPINYTSNPGLTIQLHRNVTEATLHF